MDARSDLFSLGAVLYEMVTGRLAFDGGTTAVIFDGVLNRNPTAPSRLNPDVLPQVDELIGKLLEKDRRLVIQVLLNWKRICTVFNESQARIYLLLRPYRNPAEL